jgi:glycerol-3-phosphate acyltransferase PlsX
MPEPITISVDAMGGDHGPSVVVPGVALASERNPDARFILYGKEAEVAPLLAKEQRLKDRARLVHAEVAVKMDDKPSQALRAGRWKSSMWMALEAVKAGEAHVAVSAGNTGALMAMAKFCLRTMPTIERPAIAALWPTVRGQSVVLDVGASIGAEARQLVDMSILGAAMARALLEVERPTVGLLNIGVEEVKGLEPIREAGRMLKEAALPGMIYQGFVEGSDLGKGAVDVVVTEGFAGNIALKTAEGTAKQIGEYLRSALTRTLLSKAGALLARGAFAALKDRLDPRKVNGGVFLGLNGLVIKSHGGTDAVGFANALGIGHDMAAGDLLAKIGADLDRLRREHPEIAVGPAAAKEA